jgi:hypothetical protein
MKEEFKELAMPLIKFIRENYHPHAQIIITCNTAEVLEGKLTIGIIDEIED